jgi:small subunit ribosomal protein S9
MVNKDTTTKSATAKSPRKPKAPAVKKTSGKAEAAVHHEPVVHSTPAHKETAHKAPAGEKGRYIFATGRRKTAIANVRLFPGKHESIVNKKPVGKYFNYEFYMQSINRPFDLTGLGKDYHFTAHVSGGGPNAQAEALRHGIAIALGTISEEIRKVLKKNGLLTRDDRRKERKKPGLKRARRSPQWSKR